MTKAELSRRMDSEGHEIYAYEAGRRMPQFPRLMKLAHVLGVELRDLFTFEAPPVQRHLPPAVFALALLLEREAERDPKYLARAERVLRALAEPEG